MTSRRWIPLAALFVLCACQQPGDTSATKDDAKKIAGNVVTMANEATRPVAAFSDKKSASLTYFESRAFDSDLADAMRAQVGEISVAVPTPFSLNAVPERLDHWLHAVKQSGGRVVAEALPPKETQVATRSLLPLLLEVVLPLLAQALQTDIHDYAKGYDGTLFFAPEDGRVQKIVFTKIKAQ